MEGHYVDRDSWDILDIEQDSWERGLLWTRARLDEGVPNARCPRCGQPVWFFRNPNGGCAYFEELGVPWPKHPCMDTRSINDRTAVWQARALYREEYELNERDVELEEVQASFQQSQEAWEELLERSSERAIAKQEADAAFQQVLKPGDTSSVVREQRVHWVRAREDFNRTDVAYLAAEDRWRTTREDYFRVLNKLF